MDPRTFKKAALALPGAARADGFKARYSVKLIGLSLGLRCGEVLGLRWGDLRLEGPNPHLTVSEALQYQSGNGLVLDDPKTQHSKRTIPLNAQHVEALRAVRAAQVQERLANVGEFNPQDFVFITSRGTPIDTNNDAKRWHQLLDKAGVRRVRRHDARHTTATLLLSSGASLANVQKTLGHSSIRTTVDVYGHLTAEDTAPFTAKITDALTA